MISALTFPNTAEPKGQRAPGLEELLRAHGQTDGWTATSRALPMLIRLSHVSVGEQFLFNSQMSPARLPPTRAGAKKPPRSCQAPLLQPWLGNPAVTRDPHLEQPHLKTSSLTNFMDNNRGPMAEDGSPVAQEEAWMPTSMYRSRHQPQDPWGRYSSPSMGTSPQD